MPGVSSFLSTSEEHLNSGLSSIKLSISVSKAVFVTFVVRHDSSDSLAKLLSGEISIGIVTVNGSQRQSRNSRGFSQLIASGSQVQFW